MTDYAAIDGDIADFIDAMMEVTTPFRAEELRRYLQNQGHVEAAVNSAIREWHGNRFAAWILTGRYSV